MAETEGVKMSNNCGIVQLDTYAETYNTITRADVEMALNYMSEASEHYKGIKKQRIGF